MSTTNKNINNRIRDLTGERYGKLKVISYFGQINKKTMWLCQCDCGNKKAIRGDSLTSGRTKSCGCFQKQRVRETALKDLTGMRFGRLTVIELDKNNKKKKSSAIWKCKCDCGDKIICVPSNYLLSGHKKSCGCLKKENDKKLKPERIRDLSGKRVGRLTVVKLGYRGDNGEYYWECDCDCGSKTFVTSSNLISCHVMSCGCINSKGEEKIKSILDKNGIKYKKQYYFDDLRNEDDNLLKFDFGILDNNNHLSYLLEFDGSHHFYPRGSGWNTDEHFKKTQLSDELKNNYCKDNNIPLIRIPYYEYQNICLDMLTYKEEGIICTADI